MNPLSRWSSLSRVEQLGGLLIIVCHVVKVPGSKMEKKQANESKKMNELKVLSKLRLRLSSVYAFFGAREKSLKEYANSCVMSVMRSPDQR